MTLLFIIIGLFCSLGAFGLSLKYLRDMVEKHKIHPTISEQKFRLIRNTFVSLVVATALLYVTLVGAGTYVYLQGSDVHTSLCALQGDLQVRVDSSKRFLKEHPKGLPHAEISAQVIREGIQNQERTIEVLKPLNCDTN
jgi:hypothetical protein